MFERFTGRAWRAMALAQDEARALGHDRVGTGHILLGLTGEGAGAAARTLDSLGISLQAAREQVTQLMGRGQQPLPAQIPLTSRATVVLHLALREAMHLGHLYIGTEHLLLGLVREAGGAGGREGDGVAARALAGLGTDPDQVRQQVIRLLHGYPGKTPGLAARSGKTVRGTGELLSQLLDRVSSMDSRLSALEHRVGAGPDVRDLDQEIAGARRDKESAIDAQDFQNAAVLRQRERQLAGEKDSPRQQEWEWEVAHADLPSLSEEVERLRDLLRQNGIDPQGGAA